MNTRYFFGIAAIAMSATVAVPAYAGLTAQQAWDATTKFYTSSGYKIEIGQKTESGGVLTLNNVTMINELPNGGGHVKIHSGWIKLSEVDVGAVEMTMAPNVEISATMQGNGAGNSEKSVFRAHFMTTNYRTLIAGSPDNLNVDTRMSKGILFVDELRPNGRPLPVDSTFVINDISTQYVFQPATADTLGHSSGTSTIGSIVANFSVTEPGGDGFISGSANLSGFSFGGSVTMPDYSKYDRTDPMFGLKVFRDGMSVDGSFIVASSAMSFDSNIGGKTNSYSQTAKDTRLGFAMSRDHIKYEINERDIKAKVKSSDLPVPEINLALDELSFGILLPTAQKSEPSDFKAKVAVRGLSANEALWAMIDPGQALPRDPVTMAVSVSGKLMVLMNMMDPQAMKKGIKGPPWIPTAINLDELTVSALGALLTGKGSFKVDLASGKTMDGMPVPVGSVNLDLKGAFGLIDKLIGMGLVQSDQAIGFKGMLAAFARPVGEDHFASKIEVTPDGAVLANGQRIR